MTRRDTPASMMRPIFIMEISRGLKEGNFAAETANSSSQPVSSISAWAGSRLRRKRRSSIIRSVDTPARRLSLSDFGFLYPLAERRRAPRSMRQSTRTSHLSAISFCDIHWRSLGPELQLTRERPVGAFASKASRRRSAAKKFGHRQRNPRNRDIFQQKQGDYCGKTGNYDEGLGI